MGHLSPIAEVHPSVFIHESAYLYGRIIIEQGASIWPHVVARAEVHEIRIGSCTNIQDFVMLHVGSMTPTIIGSHCSITHHCTIHGCSIGDNCLVGINATIADGCVIGDNCIIGAHAYLPEGTVIPANSVVVGTPGKVARTVDNRISNRLNAFAYMKNAQAYAQGEHRLWSTPAFQAQFAQELQRLSQAEA